MKNETNRCEILSVALNCNLLETRQQHVERGQYTVHVVGFTEKTNTKIAYKIIGKWEQQPFHIHVALSFDSFLYFVSFLWRLIVSCSFVTL